MGFFDWFNEIAHPLKNRNQEITIIQHPFYNNIDWNKPKIVNINSKIGVYVNWEHLNQVLKLHNYDGPALREFYYVEILGKSYGKKLSLEEYCVFGIHHRVGGPARTTLATFRNHIDYIKEYFYKGKRHRVDGFAVESSYYNRCYIDGVVVSPDELDISSSEKKLLKSTQDYSDSTYNFNWGKGSYYNQDFNDMRLYYSQAIDEYKVYKNRNNILSNEEIKNLFLKFGHLVKY
tara:strand:- start:115 stop:813 length:699 start_codon:yes stop_codon:yes gene_type:complete